MTWVQAPAYVTLGKLLDMPDLVSLSIKIGITGLVASQCPREAGTIHCKKTLQSPLELKIPEGNLWGAGMPTLPQVLGGLLYFAGFQRCLAK